MTATTLRPEQRELIEQTEQTVPIGPAFEEIRWCLGSPFLGLFAVALFDQAAIPEISAALENTGRFANDFISRGARSAASQQIMDWGTKEDSQAEGEKLKRLHRAVRGKSPDGRRYSALNPDLWRFIMLSTLMMYREAASQLLRWTRMSSAACVGVLLWEVMVVGVVAGVGRRPGPPRVAAGGSWWPTGSRRVRGRRRRWRRSSACRGW
jgi:uncharacterized protein (DUF2236 family)